MTTVSWEPPTADQPYGVFRRSDGTRMAPTCEIRAQGFGADRCWMTFAVRQPGPFEEVEAEVVEGRDMGELFENAVACGLLRRLPSAAEEALEGHESRFANLEFLPKPPVDPVGEAARAELDRQAAMLEAMQVEHTTAIERWAGHMRGRDELFELWAAVNGFYEHGLPVDNFMSMMRGGMRDRRLLPFDTDPWVATRKHGGGYLPGLMTDTEHLSLTSYFSTRMAACRYYAWAVTAPWLLKAVASFAAGSGVVDPMAGTGWWALRLGESYGVDVAAYDLNPPCTGSTKPMSGDDSTTVRPVAHGNGFHPDTTAWVPVDRADAAWAAARHPDRALLLAWPPYGDPIGHAAIEAHMNAGGTRVAFIGEGEGGCTGDDAMFELLGKRYEDVGEYPCAQWDGLHDWMTLYERKSA